MTGIHPKVQAELDLVSGAECPFCSVMGRINWKILDAVALSQSAACEHCIDAPEIISFLHDFITVYKKKGKPFDKDNFEKWCNTICDLHFKKSDITKCNLELLLFADKVLDEIDKSIDKETAFIRVQKLIEKIPVKKNDVFKHIAGPGEPPHNHKSDFKTSVDMATKCAPGSTRSQKMGDNHIMQICCPSGQYHKGKCNDIEIVKSITHNHEKNIDEVSEFIEDNFPRMAHAILLTDKYNVEHGFCGSSTVVGGKETDLTLPYCPGKLHFHTHNSGAMYPSNTDFNSSSSQNAIAECIGTHEGIACFHPKTRDQIFKS